MTTLIVYASTAGNTKAVAEYMASKIPESTCVEVSKVTDIDPSTYDRIIIGSRVHAGSISKDIVTFIEGNKQIIADRDPAIFLCCMFNEDKGDRQLADIKEKVGISKGVYFIGGKKIVKAGGAEIDAFLETL